MSESHSDDPAARMERGADELDHRLDKLEEHISDAEQAAKARREEATPGEAVAGDWEETRGTPGQGEDPEGAIDEPEARGNERRDAEGQPGSRTPGDAAGGDD